MHRPAWLGTGKVASTRPRQRKQSIMANRSMGVLTQSRYLASRLASTWTHSRAFGKGSRRCDVLLNRVPSLLVPASARYVRPKDGGTSTPETLQATQNTAHNSMALWSSGCALLLMYPQMAAAVATHFCTMLSCLNCSLSMTCRLALNLPFYPVW